MQPRWALGMMNGRENERFDGALLIYLGLESNCIFWGSIFWEMLRTAVHAACKAGCLEMLQMQADGHAGLCKRGQS